MGNIENYFSKDFKQKIEKFYDEESTKNKVFPPRNQIFRAFEECPIEILKVVIIGQDPYSNFGQANGLAFSVNEGITIPPSLRNIFKEISLEFGIEVKPKGELGYLAEQGVLLLNSILTVSEGKPLSHKGPFYENFFKEVIKNIEAKNDCVVYMLWGANARKFKKLITNKKHYFIETNHPSPLSANMGGWFNQNQFLKCNEILEKNGKEKIKWF